MIIISRWLLDASLGNEQLETSTAMTNKLLRENLQSQRCSCWLLASLSRESHWLIQADTVLNNDLGQQENVYNCKQTLVLPKKWGAFEEHVFKMWLRLESHDCGVVAVILGYLQAVRSRLESSNTSKWEFSYNTCSERNFYLLGENIQQHFQNVRRWENKKFS